MLLPLPNPMPRSTGLLHGKVFYVDPQWQKPLSTIGLDLHQTWHKLKSTCPISHSKLTTRCFHFTLANKQGIYFKRYSYTTFQLQRLMSRMRPSKAVIETAGLNEINQLGIPTIPVIACGEQRRFGLLQCAFIATLEIKGLQALDRYLIQTWPRLNKVEKKALLAQVQPGLIQQLQTIHRHGFYHWDLKLRNLLLNPQNPGKLIWIDCPRSRRLAPNHTYGVVKDFAAMARVAHRVLSRGQQFRFLLNYYQGDTHKARQLYRHIAAALRRKPPRYYRYAGKSQ